MPNCRARADAGGVVKVVYGGPGNVLNSHLLCWDNRDATIASRVPQVVTRENFQLILAGPMTRPQELLLAKRHECRGIRVEQAHRLLCRINPLYASIIDRHTPYPSVTNAETIFTRLAPNEDTAELISQARARQSTVARPTSESTNDERIECTVVETQTVLMETVADRTEQDRLVRAFASVTGDRSSYVVQRSTSLLSQTDPHYMERLVPHLLTFGVGGFSTVRHHHYSPRSVVLHYLRLASNRFAEDSMYKLSMFDYLSTKRVKNGVFLRIGQDPALASVAMSVTPAQLAVAMRNREAQRKAWKQGRSFIPADETASASRLLKSINATTSKMWGSNEEREALARKTDAMTIRYGAPSVFWTLTPNPDCSMTCAFWTGRQLPHGRPERLSECVEYNMPCSSDMSRLVMANTVVQAEYYRVCCYVLIDILFGWDTRARKPKTQRGIFGHIEALVYALEQQGRLFVHHHGVAWVSGFPKSQSDWDRLLSNDDTKSRFRRYCASIFCAELPVYKGVAEVNCPRSSCEGILVAVPIPKKFKHLLKPSVSAPVVAKCIVCGADLNESDIVSAIIQKKWESLDDAHKRTSSSLAVESIRHRLGGLSADDVTSDVQLTRLLLKDQVHSFAHAWSCIKGRTNSKCRYNFYRPLVDATGFNDDNEIVYKRRLGNQWLNTYIPIWRRIFHFNMDSRVLWSGHALQATRYALQYTMKRQTVLDNVAVVDMAFRKRVDRESLDQTTQYAQGVGRLLSLAYATSGVMEIGGPLATAIMLEGEAVTFGCDFERLVLLEGLNILNNVDVEATIVARNQLLYTETSISKYMARPTCMEYYCWYEYCYWVIRLGPPAAETRPCSFSASNRHDLRSHLKEHNYRLLHYPRVPEIIGPRLPDATRLGAEEYAEQTELYYRVAALLYCPFRSVDSFLDSNGSAKCHFEVWDPFGDATTARALERHQQYYICLEMAQRYRLKQRELSDEGSDADSVCDDSDIQHDAPTWSAAGASHCPREFMLIPAELYCGADLDDEMETDVGDTTFEEQPTVIQQLLRQSIASSPLPPDTTLAPPVYRAPITRAQVLSFQRQVQDIPDARATAPDGYHTSPTTAEIEVHTLEDLVARMTRPATPSAGDPIGAYASISAVSAAFNLNSAQHVGFTLIATPLLYRIMGRDIPTDQAHLLNTAPIIVTGAGGTGKSRIIAAVRAIAASWHRPAAVKVVASTGIAAASLGGCTMHSSVGLGINATRIPKHIASPNDTLLREWAPTLCIIADEVSMTDLAFLGLWEESLRHVKENPEEPFGGLLTVLMFNHCQLRAVRGAPLYKNVLGGTQLTPAQDRGHRLYHAIRKVVYLTENMRFSKDAEWGQWLQLARLGKWDEGLRTYIEGLPDHSHHQTNPYQSMTQTISTDNATRTAINEAAIRIAVQTLGSARKVYAIPARLSRRVSPTELAVIRGLPDNMTGNIPVFLQVYVGMPVRIKANQCISKGVANGASGSIHHVDWEHGTAFALQPNGTWLASVPPINIYVDIAHSSAPTRFPLLPAHWPSTVMPVYQVTFPVTLQGPALSIKGYPIVPAFGTTVHGVQGETRDSVAITNLRPPHVRHVDQHALYVALSRLRTRHGLHWIGQRPSPSDYEYFGPSGEVLLEDNRLKHMWNATLAEFGKLSSKVPVTP